MSIWFCGDKSKSFNILDSDSETIERSFWLIFALAFRWRNFRHTFRRIWDRILEYMRYEDKIDNHLMGDFSFKSGESGHQVPQLSIQEKEGTKISIA